MISTVAGQKGTSSVLSPTGRAIARGRYGLRRTIEWYLENPRWVEEILDGTYMEYYRKQYGKRLHGSKQ